MFAAEKRKKTLKNPDMPLSALGNQDLLNLINNPPVIQRSGRPAPVVRIRNDIPTTKEVPFAGGPDNILQVAHFLVEQHGGIEEEWYHWRGEALLDDGSGTQKRAEVHWFQRDGYSERYSMKLKRWLE